MPFQTIDQELRVMFSELRIDSERELSFAGTRFAALPAMSPPPLGSPPALNGLVAALQLILYEYCYCRRFRGQIVNTSNVDSEEDLLPSLRAANAGCARWAMGWHVERQLPTGQFAVNRAGRRRLIWPGEFLSSGGPGKPPRTGTSVTLYLPHESAEWQPGFYFAFGDGIDDHGDETEIVRLYWNIKAAKSPSLLHYITTALNDVEIPFRYKSLTRSSLYGRADAAVLFLARRHYDIAVRALRDCYHALREGLNDEVCLFCKPLAPGLGIAEDPGSGESFGMSRCRIVAEALWNAFVRGENGPEERLRAVREEFRRNGLDLERPHLNPHSADSYAIPAAWLEGAYVADARQPA